MSFSYAPILAMPLTLPICVKRLTIASMAGLFLVACASKPKPIASTDAYAVQSVTVSSTASDAQFKSALQDALSDAFSENATGLESELNITITNIRFGGRFASTVYGAVNGATMNVIVRSTKTNLKLRDFRISVTSNATDRGRARAQMVEKARAELKQIFRSRIQPKIVASERKNVAINSANSAKTTKPAKPVKPISLDPIGDLERKIKAEPKVVVTPAPEKPKLTPIAEAGPKVTPVPVTPQPTVAPAAPAAPAASAAPATPAVSVIEAAPVTPQPTAAPVAPAAPVATAPSTSAPAQVETSPQPSDDASAEEEALCVVTLENDCSE